MHTKTELLALLRAHGLRLSKRLSQHYLIDSRIAKRLVGSCQLAAEDTVVEIGAGLGALTDLLAAAVKRVVAVEVDPAICHLLTTRLARLSNVQVLCQDILAFDWAGHRGSKVVGTIPYQLTSPILISLCESARGIPEACLGLQREVAQRLSARPGTKAYGRLTILVQYHFEAESLIRIPRTAFFPQPQVDSVWMRLTARKRPAVSVEREGLFFAVVKAAFSQRRKTLVNCLKELAAPRLSREEALAVVRKAGLPDEVRGEALSLEAFARLADAINFATRNLSEV